MTDIFRETGEKIAPIKQKQNETKSKQVWGKKNIWKLKKELSPRFGWWNWWNPKENKHLINGKFGRKYSILYHKTFYLNNRCYRIRKLEKNNRGTDIT